MSRFVLLVILCGSLGCPGPIQPRPPGSISCRSDDDCPYGYVCSFPHVDTPPTCLWQGPPDDTKHKLDGGK
jgi:hypothetical protein